MATDQKNSMSGEGRGVLSGTGHYLRVADLFRLSLRVFRTKLTRTLLTILGISLGVGIVLFLVSLGYGLQFTLLGKLVTTEDSLITIESYYPPDSGLTVSQSEIDKLKTDLAVGGISPVAEFPAEIREIIPNQSSVDDASTTGASAPEGFLFAKVVDDNYFKYSGMVTDTGKTFTDKHEGVVISSAALKVINTPNGVGAFTKKFNIQVLFTDKDGNGEIAGLNGPVGIVGIVRDDIQPPFIVIPKSLVTKEAPFYQRLLVKARDASVIENLRDKLIAQGFLVSTHIDLVNQAQRVMNIVTWILGIFGVTALIVSAIGMFNTMIISFLERTFEIGIMKAIGATSRDIRDLFLMEALVMGLCGGFGGVAIGTVMGYAANFGLNILASNFGGRSIDLFVRPLWFEVLIVAFSGMIGLLSGLLPSRRATKISPKEAFIRK